MIKLWLLTLFLSPIVYGVYEYFVSVDGQIVGLLEIWPITLFFSLILSIPTTAAIYGVNLLLLNQKLSRWKFKLINIILAAVGIVVTLKIIDGTLIPHFIRAYLIGLIISVVILAWVDHFKKQRNALLNISNK